MLLYSPQPSHRLVVFQTWCTCHVLLQDYSFIPVQYISCTLYSCTVVLYFTSSTSHSCTLMFFSCTL
ncbi:hypothetical protein M6B38_260460 [Iris pallida]|uniref:Uncharacterized protein n=1 Tax=Iris pallida TaxID=29817 RepID=A0AAX6ICW0_IRIPA|nr:hypothetical protein M6B38_260460 [Iris pallida]